MFNKGTKIIIKYKNFSDKDLIYIIGLVNREFNTELEKKVGKPEKGNLRAPLEITRVQTGNSISIDFIVNSDFLSNYFTLRVGEFVLRNLTEVSDEMLQNAIKKAIGKFKIRRREDKLEDFHIDETE